MSFGLSFLCLSSLSCVLCALLSFVCRVCCSVCSSVFDYVCVCLLLNDLVVSCCFCHCLCLCFGRVVVVLSFLLTCVLFPARWSFFVSFCLSVVRSVFLCFFKSHTINKTGLVSHICHQLSANNNYSFQKPSTVQC